ncbi:MAG: SMI1/KNR4 family protein [Planctomycetota bacterium]
MTPSPTADSTEDSSGNWSKRIQAALGITLEASLAAWFDQEIWKRDGGFEFTECVHPQCWLERVNESLWPGLMGCHLLPLVGNQIGDYLCVRVDDFGNASSIVHWYHGGGDWLPWGKDLAEALVVEARSNELPGFAIRHAGDPFPHAPQRTLGENPWYAFATQWYQDHRGWNPAEVSKLLTPQVAQDRRLGRIPTLVGSLAEFPDHPDAIQWCDEAASYEPQLAWIWDSAGQIAESKGDLEEAAAYYDRGARCSVFTSQSVRLGHHHDEERCPKFSLSRLQQLDPQRIADDAYLTALAIPDSLQRTSSVHQHWQAIAKQYPANHRAAVFALHMSAWDLGLTRLEDYGTVIAQIVQRCRLGQLVGRGSVAAAHQRAFDARWGSKNTVGDAGA